MSVPEPVSSPSALAGWFPEGSMAVPVQGLVFHELVVVRTKTMILRQAMDCGVLGGRDEKTLAAGAAELCIPLPVAAADDRSAVTGFTDCAVAHVVHVWHPPEWAISRARLQCAACAHRLCGLESYRGMGRTVPPPGGSDGERRIRVPAAHRIRSTWNPATHGHSPLSCGHPSCCLLKSRRRRMPRHSRSNRRSPATRRFRNRFPPATGCLPR